jgi:hypothetical protein
MTPALSVIARHTCRKCGAQNAILQCARCGGCTCCRCASEGALPLPLAQSSNHKAKASPLAGALESLDATIRRYVWRPQDWEYHALAFWTLHTHAISAFDWSPLLSITSPDGGFGKTRTLLVLSGLVRDGLYREKVTASAVKRELENAHTNGRTLTLLLDQVRGHNFEWEDLLDIGVRRGATIVSNVKPDRAGDYEPHEYHVFGPKAVGSIAGHEALSGTNDSRALSLAYREKGGGKVPKPYPYDGTAPPDVIALRESLAALMSDDMLNAIRAHDTGLKPGRRNDTYRPLVVLGDLAGGAWKERARDLLRRGGDAGRINRYVQVLADLVSICEGKEDSYFLSSREAVAALSELEESPWQEQRLSPKGLATMLGAWALTSQKDDRRARRGYLVGAIRAAYERQAEESVP